MARVPQLCRGHSRPVGMKGIDKGLDASEWTGPGGHGLSSVLSLTFWLNYSASFLH